MRAYPQQRGLILMILMAAAMAFNGCATLDSIIQKPTATFAGIQFTDADLLQAKAVLNFNVTNPNVLNIRASRISYDLKINGRDFVAGELDHGITLVGGSTSILSIPFSIQYLDFFESLAQCGKPKALTMHFLEDSPLGPSGFPYKPTAVLSCPKCPKSPWRPSRLKISPWTGPD
jgi:LEA14-like dessication related protein